MQLRNKFYPYPVLIEGGNYYEDSIFTTNVVTEQEGYNVKLNFESNLNDQILQKLITHNQAIYVHHIECAQTCFRKIIRSNKQEVALVIKDQDINGAIQVCSFIVANENLEKYENPNFSSDYKGFKFNIDKGCVLGVGNQYNIIIEKVKDDFKKTSSIFSIIPDDSEESTLMSVRLGKDKIIISLPRKTHSQYRIIQDSIDMQPMMHSSIIIPALVYTFSELLKDGEEVEEINGSYRWYRSLKKACAAIGSEITIESLKQMNFLEVSQRLLNEPIIKAINYSAIGGGVHED